MGTLIYNIKRYYKFSPEELRGLIIGIVILAFTFSFDEWGTDKFDFIFGLGNFFNALLIATLAMLVHHSAQRIGALHVGFKGENRIWFYGLIAGLIIAFLSNGRFFFLAPSGFVVYHMAGHRIGAYRYGLNYWPHAWTAILGPVFNMVLAFFFKIMLYFFPGNTLLWKAMIFNMWFAIFNLLPIPPLDGSHMLFASRFFYIFVYTTVIAWSVLLYYYSVLVALLVGILIGAVCWLLYYVIIEVE